MCKTPTNCCRRFPPQQGRVHEAVRSSVISSSLHRLMQLLRLSARGTSRRFPRRARRLYSHACSSSKHASTWHNALGTAHPRTYHLSWSHAGRTSGLVLSSPRAKFCDVPSPLPTAVVESMNLTTPALSCVTRTVSSLPTSIIPMIRTGERQPRCSPKTRRGGSRPRG